MKKNKFKNHTFIGSALVFFIIMLYSRPCTAVVESTTAVSRIFHDLQTNPSNSTLQDDQVVCFTKKKQVGKSKLKI